MSFDVTLTRLKVADYKYLTEEHFTILRKFALTLQAMIDECNKNLETETRKLRPNGCADDVSIVSHLKCYTDLIERKGDDDGN